MIRYKTSGNMRVLFVGINPHPGSYRRAIPFSNNKTFWYLMNKSGMIREKPEDLRDDRTLAEFYNRRFNRKYGLGLVNVVDRPTRDVTELRPGEEIPGRKRIARIVGSRKPRIVCFVGKIAYEKFSGRKKFRFGWQKDIGASRAYVMRFPLHGRAAIRIREFRALMRASGGRRQAR